MFSTNQLIAKIGYSLIAMVQNGITKYLTSAIVKVSLLVTLMIPAWKTIRAQGILDTYIAEGLASNQSIRQQHFLLKKNIFALKEAKSMFLPSVTFSATYTKSDGGRTIDFPAGDLLNGVYASLNHLNQTSEFPQLENQSIQLNPDNFYDARFRTSIPILNMELIYNKHIRGQQVDLQKTEILLYKRELVNEIKSAYYQYAKAVIAVQIYESSLQLVEEGKRINAALFKNNKVNRSGVIRSNNEVSRVNASLTVAKRSRESAGYYFNFLLNKPLTDSIIVEPVTVLPQLADQLSPEVSKREELVKLKLAQDINLKQTGLARSYIIPKVSTYIDLGSQAFDWNFNRKSRYYFLGVALQWDLFTSGKNSYRVKQSLAEQQSLEARQNYVEQQLLMALRLKQREMQSAVARYEAAQSQLSTAKIYYSDELKLYKEGLAIYIELLDAQNQLINAQLDANIALYDTWISHAAIERANASFTIN